MLWVAGYVESEHGMHFSLPCAQGFIFVTSTSVLEDFQTQSRIASARDSNTLSASTQAQLTYLISSPPEKDQQACIDEPLPTSKNKLKLVSSLGVAYFMALKII